MENQLTSTRLDLYPRSPCISAGVEYGLAHTKDGPNLVILAQPGIKALEDFDGQTTEFGDHILVQCPLTHKNAWSLRRQINWLQPQLLGLKTSAGMGDRLGIATPGHVRAMRATGGKIAPIFAQQSVREMSRTGRTPQQVMDDATWGIFEEGWQDGVGSDADHLKTRDDIDACLAAGFTLFTIDPGEHVSDDVNSLSLNQLRERIDHLPEKLQPQATGLLGKTIHIEGSKQVFDEVTVQRAVVKYGKALGYVADLYEHLEKGAGRLPFEVEISMDETEQPTSPAEHIYIASELQRMGVKWVSFAPRFVGRFEKGVDYIGDVRAFEADLAIHAAIARQFGPYKLSLHSGSDKFSIYQIFMEKTKGLAHLKTAGTSYLEALRTIAALDKELFEEIYRFALDHFEADKRTYHISAQIEKAPKPGEIQDWPGMLEQFDSREILHVTFGSVLTSKASDGKQHFYGKIMSVLETHREEYFHNLEKHFKRHLQPFSSQKDA